MRSNCEVTVATAATVDADAMAASRSIVEPPAAGVSARTMLASSSVAESVPVKLFTAPAVVLMP